MHKTLARAALMMTLTLVGPTSAPVARLRPAVHAQSPDDAVAQRFVGMWRLVSWTVRAADGTTRPGIADQGYLVYADVGRMCAVIMDSRRTKWGAGTPATVAAAMDRVRGQVAYCASVEVHAREGYVLHDVDVERNPAVVGTVRKRWFAFEGPNRLSLKIDSAELTSGTTDSTLVWERVAK